MHPPKGGPLLVLVVDDNPDDLAVFERSVRPNGWHVVTAATGRQGLDRALKERFDVIVLDYNLGDMTGTEVLLRIKEGGIHTPVLIQSGLGSDFIVARALALGADGFVAKDSPQYAQDVTAKVGLALQRGRGAGLSPQRPGQRESIREVETILDDLMDRGKGRLLAVGFASPDGFRVSTRFKKVRSLTPETICAMVASATSTCNFLGEGLNLPGLRLVEAQFQGGRIMAAPVPGYGVLFGALDEVPRGSEGTHAELEFAAKELTTILSAAARTERPTTY